MKARNLCTLTIVFTLLNINTPENQNLFCLFRITDMQLESNEIARRDSITQKDSKSPTAYAAVPAKEDSVEGRRPSLT